MYPIFVHKTNCKICISVTIYIPKANAIRMYSKAVGLCELPCLFSIRIKQIYAFTIFISKKPGGVCGIRSQRFYPIESAASGTRHPQTALLLIIAVKEHNL